MTHSAPAVPEVELHRRAWELRRRVLASVAKKGVTEHSDQLWKAAMQDVDEGSCFGPFFSEGDVTRHTGSDRWIPTERFPVVQKDKVRGVDSATVNLINGATAVVEKLVLPNIDTCIGVLRKLASQFPGVPLAGWMLDERKAYRQVAIQPEHRRYSVIALMCPHTARPGFFVMVGHSFGLTAAVYNYNRRSALINDFLVKLLLVPAFSFYDDKFGFEFEHSVKEAHEYVQALHTWLGAWFDESKLACGQDLDVLGVFFQLSRLQVDVKESRRRELLAEIADVLSRDRLEPGHAGKLKGKLLFASSQLWGRVGRAFLRPISERQYHGG
eukprot:422068-Amphidinium_carterae.1